MELHNLPNEIGFNFAVNAYQNRVDSCQKIIDNPKTDNKTIVGYYAFFRLKITKSDMTQETLDAGGMQLTKDFRIIENNLKE